MRDFGPGEIEAKIISRGKISGLMFITLFIFFLKTSAVRNSLFDIRCFKQAKAISLKGKSFKPGKWKNKNNVC